jgi:hypothetical protein
MFNETKERVQIRSLVFYLKLVGISNQAAAHASERKRKLFGCRRHLIMFIMSIAKRFL